MTDSTPAASQCPLCGGDNQCAMATGRAAENCWCWSVTIDPEAREKARDTAHERCLCPACGLASEEQTDAG